MRFFITLALFLFSFFAFSHSGRTNGEGCHNDDKNGEQHCHQPNDKDQESASTDGLDQAENYKNSAQLAQEHIQKELSKKPFLEKVVYGSKGASPEIQKQKEPVQTEVSHEIESPEMKPRVAETESRVAETENPEQNIKVLNGSEEDTERDIASTQEVNKIDFSKKVMIFYDEHCKTPSSCVEVPVFTNLKSVMFKYHVRSVNAQTK